MPPPMSIFYFHIREGDHRFDDLVGVELNGFDEAWRQAIADARCLVLKRVLDGPIESHSVEIGDHTGAVVASMPFGRSMRIH